MADGESERSKTTLFLTFISFVKNNKKCLNSIVKLCYYIFANYVLSNMFTLLKGKITRKLRIPFQK